MTGGDGRLRVFEVTEMKVVDADASGLYADAPGNRLALVTCWPFGSTTPGLSGSWSWPISRLNETGRTHAS